jgi:hypothetical protein
MASTRWCASAAGRFPGFDVLDQAPHWDQVMAEVVAARSGPFPGARRRPQAASTPRCGCTRRLCEFLPQPENRVTLAAEKDRYGRPVARFASRTSRRDRNGITDRC